MNRFHFQPVIRHCIAGMVAVCVASSLGAQDDVAEPAVPPDPVTAANPDAATSDDGGETAGATGATNAGTSRSGRKIAAAAVARRALILRALYSLRFQEQAAAEVLGSMAERLNLERERLAAWVHHEGAWGALGTWEKEVLLSRVGELGERDFARLRRLDADLETLLFALGEVDRLQVPDGTHRDRSDAIAAVPAPGRKSAEFVEQARLRDPEALRRAVEMAQLWQLRAAVWRRVDARDFPEGDELERLAKDLRPRLHEVGLLPRAMPDGEAFFDELVRYSAYLASGLDMAEHPIDNDFPALGKAYRSLSPSEQQRVEALAREQLAILQWTLGEGPTPHAEP